MIETRRMIAKYDQKCSVCREKVVKGDCLVVVIGTPSACHKKCLSDMIEYEIERREKLSERMMGNTFGSR